MYRKDGKKETIDTIRQGPMTDVWNRALSNKWGRLAQGNVHGVKAQILFISLDDMKSRKEGK